MNASEYTPNEPAREAPAARRKVLLVGNWNPSLLALRRLTAAGYQIIVGCGDRDRRFARSRYAHEVQRFPSPEESPARFIDALVSFLELRPDVTIVFPVDETSVTCVARNMHRLPARVTAAVANAEAVLSCVHKDEMHRLSRAVGVPVARFVVAETRADVFRAAGEVGYPCVVKPTATGEIFGRKVLLAASRSDIERLLPDWPQNERRLIVQSYAGSGRKNVYFAARHGEILRECHTQIRRTDMPDGTGLVVDGETVPVDPRLHHYTARLLEQLHYTGIGCAQYQMDEDRDRFSFLEINPRLCGATGVACYSGLDLPLLAVELAAGHSVEKLPRNFYPAGKRYSWRQRDFGGLAFAWRRGDIGLAGALRWTMRLAGAWLRSDVDVGWSWRDPVPSAANFIEGLLRVTLRWRRQSAALHLEKST